MKLTLNITIDSDHAAVVDDPVEELTQVAQRVIQRLLSGGDLNRIVRSCRELSGNVLDTNGNTVGTFTARVPHR